VAKLIFSNLFFDKENIVVICTKFRRTCMLYQKIYKILTYILYPFAFLFAINVVSSLLVALANPLMLVIVFVMACVPLYVFFTINSFLRVLKKPSLVKKV